MSVWSLYIFVNFKPGLAKLGRMLKFIVHVWYQVIKRILFHAAIFVWPCVLSDRPLAL